MKLCFLWKRMTKLNQSTSPRQIFSKLALILQKLWSKQHLTIITIIRKAITYFGFNSQKLWFFHKRTSTLHESPCPHQILPNITLVLQETLVCASPRCVQNQKLTNFCTNPIPQHAYLAVLVPQRGPIAPNPPSHTKHTHTHTKAKP